MDNVCWRGSERGGREDGFTLVEVIVVLSVILLLTGIAVPMLSSYMEDGRRARAEAECKVLGSAVMSFYKDLGYYPARNSSATDNHVYVLLSGPTKPSSNPWSASHSFATWAVDATRGDILDNHLLNNMPGGQASAAYPVTGNLRWRGPYVAGGTPVDPWSNPYVVNILGGWYSHATNHKRMFVLSAGPNGRIDTAATATSADDIAGDDIGLILTQQQ
ncbi:MAG: type II secretion system protein GspG [bacterium]|nr:type II secretion system protein GspG [bacterium]